MKNTIDSITTNTKPDWAAIQQMPFDEQGAALQSLDCGDEGADTIDNALYSLVTWASHLRHMGAGRQAVVMMRDLFIKTMMAGGPNVERQSKWAMAAHEAKSAG
jgi:hypothetical protein